MFGLYNIGLKLFYGKGLHRQLRGWFADCSLTNSNKWYN